jgi:hypothetical protein
MRIRQCFSDYSDCRKFPEMIKLSLEKEAREIKLVAEHIKLSKNLQSLNHHVCDRTYIACFTRDLAF